MKKSEAIKFAVDSGMDSFDNIRIIQSEGWIDHPHHHRGQKIGPYHVDAWVVKYEYGD